MNAKETDTGQTLHGPWTLPDVNGMPDDMDEDENLFRVIDVLYVASMDAKRSRGEEDSDIGAVVRPPADS